MFFIALVKNLSFLSSIDLQFFKVIWLVECLSNWKKYHTLPPLLLLIPLFISIQDDEKKADKKAKEAVEVNVEEALDEGPEKPTMQFLYIQVMGQCLCCSTVLCRPGLGMSLACIHML